MKKLGILLWVPAVVFAHKIYSNMDIIPLDAMPMPKEMIAERRSHIEEMQKKGYVENDTPFLRRYIHQLLLMQGKSPEQARATQPSSEGLKASAAEVKTMFKFNPVLPNPKAFKGEIKWAFDDGWSEINEYFDGGDVGMCIFSMFIHSSDEKFKFNREGLTYEVNDRPTYLTIEGHMNMGFMYTVQWYDKNYGREIGCANLKYDKTIIDKIIVLAKMVDNS